MVWEEQINQIIDNYIYKLSYNEMLHKNEIPSLSNDDKNTIKLLLFNNNYNKILKPLVYKLYKYTDIDNLLYCCINLQDVKLNKLKPTSKEPKDRILFRLFDGSYDKLNNIIEYKTKNDISHELLHLASTKPTKYKTGKKSGFSYVIGTKKYLEGINEGYTELLNRRIFFNEKYNTYSYRKKVYFMRLIELLYNSPKDMEADYFKANSKAFIKQLTNFTTKNEFNELSSTMDKLDFTIKNDELKKTFILLQNIISRTNDDKKIILSKKYTNEYYKSKSV